MRAFVLLVLFGFLLWSLNIVDAKSYKPVYLVHGIMTGATSMLIIEAEIKTVIAVIFTKLRLSFLCRIFTLSET